MDMDASTTTATGGPTERVLVHSGRASARARAATTSSWRISSRWRLSQSSHDSSRSTLERPAPQKQRGHGNALSLGPEEIEQPDERHERQPAERKRRGPGHASTAVRPQSPEEHLLNRPVRLNGDVAHVTPVAEGLHVIDPLRHGGPKGRQERRVAVKFKAGAALNIDQLDLFGDVRLHAVSVEHVNDDELMASLDEHADGLGGVVSEQIGYQHGHAVRPAAGGMVARRRLQAGGPCG